MIKNPIAKHFMSTIAAAPILYLIGLAISLLAYLVFPWQLFGTKVADITEWIGLALVILATALVFWAQGIARRGEHHANRSPTVDDFMRGPYKYMRHPGALGLMIMFAGFVLVTNSIVMAVLLGLFITLETFWFIPMEESVYMEKSPDAYGEYRKRVRMWL